MTLIEAELRLVLAWTQAWARSRVQALREEDSDRGDGILTWVIVTAALAAAAIIIVAIIVAKAKDKANKTNTQ